MTPARGRGSARACGGLTAWTAADVRSRARRRLDGAVATAQRVLRALRAGARRHRRL